MVAQMLSAARKEMHAGLTLVTGASGYVGGRLVRELERRNEPVRCMARRPEFLQPKVASTTEVVTGDVFNLDSLRAAMAGLRKHFSLRTEMLHSHRAARSPAKRPPLRDGTCAAPALRAAQHSVSAPEIVWLCRVAWPSRSLPRRRIFAWFSSLLAFFRFAPGRNQHRKPLEPALGTEIRLALRPVWHKLLRQG